LIHPFRDFHRFKSPPSCFEYFYLKKFKQQAISQSRQMLSSESQISDPKRAGFGLNPTGMISAKAIGKIQNPNIEIRNKFKYQMS